MPRPIIFDFDGVIVDSETLSNRALAESLTAHGFPTTVDESVERYTGMRMADCVLAIERFHGRKSDGFVANAPSAELLRQQLKPIAGAVLIRGLDRRIAIASSKQAARWRSVSICRVADCRRQRFSAADMARGKPARTSICTRPSIPAPPLYRH
jgi:beta-phosphoglucomutase-like phosphatase (HAD superfamily)